MYLDLQAVPFSRRGSWLAVSWREGRLPRQRNVRNLAPGLYLRSVHGAASPSEVVRLDLLIDGDPVGFDTDTQPELLSLTAGSARIEICFASSKCVLVRGSGAGVRISPVLATPYDVVVQQTDRSWHFVSHGSDVNLAMSAHAGDLTGEVDWNGDSDDDARLTIAPDSDGRIEVALTDVGSGIDDEGPYDFDRAVRGVADDFRSWLDVIPSVPDRFAETAELAAYVNWSSIVDPQGRLQRPTMLMSKNWMTNVWSWDHCFNALGLDDPHMAEQQFMIPFDTQDGRGCLPDSVNDEHASFSFVKPPVHGWALNRLADTVGVSDQFAATVYEPLAAWTRWWFDYRDRDHDGVPHYHHGNDSGWDNATAFAKGVPIESPDLVAFLAVQTRTLADLAARLHKPDDDAEQWRTLSQRLEATLLETFWRDDHFVARHAVSHEVVENESLLMFIPLVLGERLPTPVVDALVERLQKRGFVTTHGLATESPHSPNYEADGYWRGPVWAPATMIIFDGLQRAGRTGLAETIAESFCASVAASGMAENFDALTGVGLRDRAYTWTASVFLRTASTLPDTPPVQPQ